MSILYVIYIVFTEIQIQRENILEKLTFFQKNFINILYE